MVFVDEEKRMLEDSINRMSIIIKATIKAGKEVRGEEEEEEEEE